MALYQTPRAGRTCIQGSHSTEKYEICICNLYHKSTAVYAWLVGAYRVHIFDVLERDEERNRHHHVQRQQVA